MTVEQTFQRNLTAQLKLRGWSPRELAKRSGIGYRIIYYYVNGERVPTISTLDAIAKAFQIKAACLLI